MGGKKDTGGFGLKKFLEKIRSAVGSTQLLLSQKVQQFFRLCQQSMDPTAFPVPTFQDLAGFWDLLQLSIEDVTLKFLELQQLKANSWKLLEPKIGVGVEERGEQKRLGQQRQSRRQMTVSILQSDYTLGHYHLLGPCAYHSLSCQDLLQPPWTSCGLRDQN
ncbi:hypothetical protein MC885_001468 [Smutsia gigantea]|nr:hypothetical protein MC885_001468 [Smutsia gigantea]